MKRYWLLFSQTVTVLLAAYFVVVTLKPEWLHGAAPGAMLGDAALVDRANDASALGTAPATQGSLAAAARKASGAVVSISTSKAARRNPQRGEPWFKFFFGDQDQGGEPPQPSGGVGSGVIVSAQGYVLTNNHVVEGADAIEVILNDTRRAKAKVIGTDPESDLAVLKIELDRLPVINLGNSDALQVGDTVLAIGNPFGVGQTVTSGIVSALGRNQLGINTFENFIQTDAAINPGNSGGALVDANGTLMGINTAIYSRSGGSLGIGFAIPVASARMVMDAIIKDGQVTRGWIGVEPQEITPELAEAFKLNAQIGVLVTGVMQNGPAAKGGIQPGDVITQVAGKTPQTVPQLLGLIAALKPGKPALMRVQRKHDALELQIVPGARPKQQLPKR
jgi:serine protease DegQ